MHRDTLATLLFSRPARLRDMTPHDTSSLTRGQPFECPNKTPFITISRHVQLSHGGGALVLIQTSRRNRERYGGNERHLRSASPSNPALGDTACGNPCGVDRYHSQQTARQVLTEHKQQLERLVLPAPGVRGSTRPAHEGSDGLGQRGSGTSGTYHECLRINPAAAHSTDCSRCSWGSSAWPSSGVASKHVDSSWRSVGLGTEVDKKQSTTLS